MNDPGFDRQFTLDALGFCGKELEVPTIPFRVLTSDWQSTELLAGISPHNTSLVLASDPGFQAIIRNDTESEYDANNFCTRLAERVAEGTLSLSPEFLKFCQDNALNFDPVVRSFTEKLLPTSKR